MAQNSGIQADLEAATVDPNVNPPLIFYCETEH